jgi:hypothetical protein
LKKNDKEAKICTLYVPEKYQDQGIATIILHKAFEWLVTSKPLVTVAGYKVDMLERIIRKNGWELSQVLDDYYTNRSQEYVYNGGLKLK